MHLQYQTGKGLLHTLDTYKLTLFSFSYSKADELNSIPEFTQEERTNSRIWSYDVHLCYKVLKYTYIQAFMIHTFIHK